MLEPSRCASLTSALAGGWIHFRELVDAGTSQRKENGPPDYSGPYGADQSHQQRRYDGDLRRKKGPDRRVAMRDRSRDGLGLLDREHHRRQDNQHQPYRSFGKPEF